MKSFSKSRASYLSEDIRKSGIPPIILIRKGGDIPEDVLRHEIIHMKADEMGWIKIGDKAYDLLWSTYYELLSTLWGKFESATFLHTLNFAIEDFFADEIECQYGLFSEVIKERRIRLNNLLRDLRELLDQKRSLTEKEWKITSIQLTIWAVFLTTLPLSYPKKREERKLKKIIIRLLHRIGTKSEYSKLKSIISELKFPPMPANIYKCFTQVIELAQEFLEK